jgi:hypothetical protein
MEVKEIDGAVRVYVRPGIYREYGSRIETLIEEAKLFCGFSNEGRTRCLLPKELEVHIGLTSASVSRVKNGAQPLPRDWLLRIHAWSGMPIRQLEVLSGVESPVVPYVRPQPVTAEDE